MNENTTIKLDFPIKIDGKDVSELSVRRPKVRDQLAASKKTNEQKREIFLFANLCQLSPDDIQNLDMKDYGKIQKVYVDFLS